MKKYVFIGIIALVLVTTIAFLWLKSKHETDVETLIPPGLDVQFGTSGTSSTVGGTGSGPTSSSTSSAFPPGLDIEKIKQTSEYFGSGGYALYDSDDYQITYDDLDHSFNIAINNTPVGWYRKLAEEELIKKLSVSKEEICKLNIFVGAPARIDPNGPYGYGLSFCPGSVVLPALDPNAQ